VGVAVAYKLGPVKPHVASAANSVGPQFGIKTIWGFGSGSVPGSDHPKGLALDYMINNIPNGKAVGDALANYLIANATALGIKYIIWYRREWSPSGGWKKYTGFNPHVDHVHASFNATPGTGNATGATSVGNPLVPDSVEQLKVLVNDIGKSIEWITKPESLMRVGIFMGGAMLVFIAIVGLPTGKTVANVAGKVMK
jgi:hypothetical protein